MNTENSNNRNNGNSSNNSIDSNKSTTSHEAEKEEKVMTPETSKKEMAEVSAKMQEPAKKESMEEKENETMNIKNNQEKLHGQDHERRKEYLLHAGPISTKIYEREIFFDKEFRFPEHMSYEDNAVFVEIGMRIKHFEHIPEPNVFYYQHGDSTTHTFDMKKCKDRMEAMRIMLKYSKENGALEEFHDVIEFHFSNLFYRNTLFAYMQSDIKKDMKFIRKLGEEMVATFPDFRQNSYYNKTVNDYEQKLINLHLKSTLAFMIIFKLKMISRKLKSKKARQ